MHITLKYDSNSKINSGWYNAMLQIAKSEDMINRLQLTEFSGSKIKPVEKFSVMLASSRINYDRGISGYDI